MQLEWDTHYGEVASWEMRASSCGNHHGEGTGGSSHPSPGLCLLRGKRVEEEPKTVRDKSKVLVGGFPICLKDAIHPEGPLVV